MVLVVVVLAVAILASGEDIGSGAHSHLLYHRPYPGPARHCSCLDSRHCSPAHTRHHHNRHHSTHPGDTGRSRSAEDIAAAGSSAVVVVVGVADPLDHCRGAEAVDSKTGRTPFLTRLLKCIPSLAQLRLNFFINGDRFFASYVQAIQSIVEPYSECLVVDVSVAKFAFSSSWKWVSAAPQQVFGLFSAQGRSLCWKGA